jgi:hypothetical protein
LHLPQRFTNIISIGYVERTYNEFIYETGAFTDDLGLKQIIQYIGGNQLAYEAVFQYAVTCAFYKLVNIPILTMPLTNYIEADLLQETVRDLGLVDLLVPSLETCLKESGISPINLQDKIPMILVVGNTIILTHT